MTKKLFIDQRDPMIIEKDNHTCEQYENKIKDRYGGKNLNMKIIKVD